MYKRRFINNFLRVGITGQCRYTVIKYGFWRVSLILFFGIGKLHLASRHWSIYHQALQPTIFHDILGASSLEFRICFEKIQYLYGSIYKHNVEKCYNVYIRYSNRFDLVLNLIHTKLQNTYNLSMYKLRWCFYLWKCRVENDTTFFILTKTSKYLSHSWRHLIDDSTYDFNIGRMCEKLLIP